MEEKPKLTQGQSKTRLRLKELFENDTFKRELEAIKTINNGKKRNKMIWKFAENYSLEFEPGSPFFDIVMGWDPKLENQIGHELDVCQLYDEVDEYLNENFPADFDIPPSRNRRKRAQIIAFPVHIGISVYATKRDVLDFIAKRWDWIRYMLDCNEEHPMIPRKKRKGIRDEYIWEHRLLPSKDLAEKVNTNFPNESLTYSDIDAIKNYLRKRKS